ncbi:MAG: hypothetical protein U5K69_16530 [Balneolaceae bacterium]|nr:hypothetical protein [Balneolaceae bacterium]
MENKTTNVPFEGGKGGCPNKGHCLLIPPYPGLGMLSEEQEAKKEFAVPVRSTEASSKREGPLANFRRRLRSRVQHSPALMVAVPFGSRQKEHLVK